MENASDDFPSKRSPKISFSGFAGSSPPISPKTSPTTLWKSLVLKKPTLRNRYANQSHGSNSCNCKNKSLGHDYVIVTDVFLPWEAEAGTCEYYQSMFLWTTVFWDGKVP